MRELHCISGRGEPPAMPPMPSAMPAGQSGVTGFPLMDKMVNVDHPSEGGHER